MKQRKEGKQMSNYSFIMSQGLFSHKDALTIPYEERAVQFGDGVYEVIRVYDGRPYLMKEHIDRLYRSLEAIKIDLTIDNPTLTQLLVDLLEKNNMTSDGHIYLQVSRGSAPRTHVFPEKTVPNIYAYVKDTPRHMDKLENGVHTIILPDERWDNCYIKSLNLLPNVLAKQTAAENNCYEAILHRDGVVTECGSSNIFLVKDGKIYTHPTTNHILNGCVRMAVERFTTNLNIPFINEAFTIDDINDADEIFLTSSMSEVLPVVQVDGKQVANGKPGTITRQLQKAYNTDAQIEGTKKAIS